MQVCCTVESVWRRVRAGNRAGGFQLLGFDFMLDSSHKVWLIEVNGAPAAASRLTNALAHDILALCMHAHPAPTKCCQRHPPRARWGRTAPWGGGPGPPPPPPPLPTVAPTRVPTVHSLPPSLADTSGLIHEARSIPKFVAADAALHHTLLLDVSGRVFAVGGHEAGRLGMGDHAHRFYAAQAPPRPPRRAPSSLKR